jgi:hypothetical protein
MALDSTIQTETDMRSKIHTALTATLASLLLAACGGGGGSATPTATTPTTPAASTTISGAAVKGPVNGATVTVKNASTGASLGTTTTGAGGSYSVTIPYNGDVIVEVIGGTYTDEATNLATALTTPLKAVLNANGNVVTAVVTPLTTMAFNQAFGNSAAVAITSAAFDLIADGLALQFKLPGVNLATSLPTVTGSLNDYGRVLAGLSKYLQLNNVSLQTLVNSTRSTAQWGAFSTAFTAAYKTAIPGSNITYLIDGNALTVGGTGAGGGTGTCGVNLTGSVSLSGTTVPLNLNYCYTGIASGSCNTGNGSLAESLNAQKVSLPAGFANLAYTYSSACVAKPDFTFRLQ